jgi:hypothetical protein
MNAIYHTDGIRVLLDLTKEHDIPLLFVTNNACNELLRFENAEGVVEVSAWGLDGRSVQ